MHVLVCDDDAGTRLVLRRILTQRLGCTVTECIDGMRALACISSEPFDLILLDIEMPALSGIQIVETMREAGTLGRQPVVMITSDSRAEVVQHLLALGVADFLVKPVQAEAMIEKLGRIQVRLASIPAGGPSGCAPSARNASI